MHSTKRFGKKICIHQPHFKFISFTFHPNMLSKRVRKENLYFIPFVTVNHNHKSYHVSHTESTLYTARKVVKRHILEAVALLDLNCSWVSNKLKNSNFLVFCFSYFTRIQLLDNPCEAQIFIGLYIKPHSPISYYFTIKTVT